MGEDRGRCGWGAVVAAVALCASLVLVTPAAATAGHARPGSVAVAVVVRERAGTADR